MGIQLDGEISALHERSADKLYIHSNMILHVYSALGSGKAAGSLWLKYVVFNKS